MNPERRLEELGLSLPQAAKPVAAYVPAVRVGDLVFISGQIPMRDGSPVCLGKVGADVDVATATDAAKTCCVQGLAALKTVIGDLGFVRRVVRIGVFVASAEGFTGQPQVANGASELLEQVFGEAGRHARAAVGVAELPLGVCVEVELLFEVSPPDGI
ncbi:MAG TPA: RidA family protein [Actinomycetota bacterium]|nr:RidA family protein [Actinomycetota bacterium]